MGGVGSGSNEEEGAAGDRKMGEGGGGGSATHLFRDGAPFLLLIYRHFQHLGAHYVFSIYYMKKNGYLISYLFGRGRLRGVRWSGAQSPKRLKVELGREGNAIGHSSPRANYTASFMTWHRTAPHRTCSAYFFFMRFSFPRFPRGTLGGKNEKK